MAKEICISSTPHETRLAILEEDQLAEIYYERENEYTLAGSIYKGRVTRVLPGMQSAFVDLGLDRDAFLYVTDFMELEDQEETDELEQAATTGQPVRESQRGNGRGEERGGDRGRGPREQRPEPGQETRRERHEPRVDRQREPQPQEQEPATASAEAAAPSAEPHAAGEQAEATGGRRWRGRRHRRGRSGAPQEGSSEDRMSEAEEVVEEFQSAAGMPTGASPAKTAFEPAAPATDHRAAVPAPFVLPGESLSKYGGAPPETAKPESSAPARPRSTSKPSTMVNVPLDWDPSSGLLPGESLARRHRQPEPESEEAAYEAEVIEVSSSPEEFKPEGSAAEEIEPGEVEPEGFEEDEFIEESEESLPPSLREIENPQESTAPVTIEPLTEEGRVGETAAEAAQEEAVEPNADSEASHRIDPASPTGFRLFGLGGKKKKESDASVATAAPASSYAPGVGHIEEEVIEGDELENAHARRHKPVENEFDDLEEQTLPAQARSGALGEMLQEAHLDARIQLRMGQVAGEEEDEAYDIVEEEEEEPSETQAGAPSGPGQPRRERHDRDRGRRGRGPQGQRRGPSRRSMQTSDLPIISDLLKPGQEILVQIAKEPIAKKGARITSHIALPGRFLVFMPTVSHVGVSRKIASDEERHRLKRILTHERGETQGGFIVRTAAEGASEEELRADLRFLMNLWSEIKQRSDTSKSPALIYHDLSLIERILRDQVSENFSNIWVDSEADYERIVRFLNRFSPNLVRRVKLYTKETPLFEHFGIQDEISKALRSKVWLKSGGSIVINQTEALVAIDINTGKYVGKSARLEDTILKTNLDAVPEIVRQIRLRDLGGIIVIDFIDMDERKNRFKVMAALEEALKSDRAPTKVLQFNDFGLVAITRKRVKQSLERTLSIPCPTCQATGMVKSPTTVCNEIYIEMRKMRKHFESSDVLVRVHPETAKLLKANNARWIDDLEAISGKNVLIKSDATLHPEQFDVQG